MKLVRNIVRVMGHFVMLADLYSVESLEVNLENLHASDF